MTNYSGNTVYGIDKSTHAIETIQYEHHEVHAGSSYVAWAYDADLDNTDTLIIAFTTPDTTKWLHMAAEFKNTSASLVEVLEAPTITADSGGKLTTINRNRNSSNASGVLSIESVPIAGDVSVNPTITADGTVIDAESIGTGKDKGVGVSRASVEKVLAQNTTYAFRITGSADDGNASIRLHWYEHTDKG